jgi:HAD superfamily hydrolase (TIGR01509 family)
VRRPAPSRFAPHAILFDLDGLLVDSEVVWARAENAMMERWGAPWTEVDQHACRGTGIPETARRMAARAGRAFDEARDPEALVDTFLSLASTIEDKPGARELVLSAREAGLPIAVASSSPLRVVRTVLEARSLLGLFDALATGDEVARTKPDPALFLLAARRLSTAPERCLVLEDSLPGVIGAKNAGIPVIAVPEAEREAFEGVADAVVSDLHEARRLIDW